jgi:signal transduction histidine kinase
VEIRLQPDQKKLLLQVLDNGRGFDPELTDTGNGLGNMQKRAEALQGKITIQSAPAKGTVVRLLIPTN